MKWHIFLIFYNIFMCLEATNPRTVNLALQTVLEFNSKNNSGDLRMIDKARDFLKDLKRDITIKQDRYDRGHNDYIKHRVYISGKKHKHERKPQDIEEPYKFTDFVKNILEVLTTYDDDSLTEAVNAIADVINKYSVEKSSKHKFLGTPQFRRTMSQNIESLNDASAQDIRNKLNTIIYMIDMDLFTDKQRDVIDFIDSLHGQNFDDDFRNLVNNLRHYGRKSKRANFSLTELIRNGIRAVLEQYSKRISRTDLKTFWKHKGDNTDSKDCALFCPMLFPFLNKETVSIKENKTRGKISKSLSEVNDNKEQRNDNDGKINRMIERIKKKKINEKVAELFDVIEGKKGKRKRKQHRVKQTEVIGDEKKKSVQKTLSDGSDKSKEKTETSPSRLITLYEEPLTKIRKHSGRRKTTRMAENDNKKRKKRNRIVMRDSMPENNVIYEHDAAIDVLRSRISISGEQHLKEKLPKMSITKIHSQEPVTEQKALNNPSASSDEGLTIESFENVPSIRRSYQGDRSHHKSKTSGSARTGADILNRLKNLEKQLDVVKKQISEVNLRKNDAEIHDTSIEKESTDSAVENKSNKITKIVVNKTTTTKVHTLEIDKHQLRFRSFDDELYNKLNDSIEGNEVMPTLNDKSIRVGDNNKKYDLKLNTTTVPYSKRLDTTLEDKERFEKNTTEKQNKNYNISKEMHNEFKTKLKLNRNDDYKNITQSEKPRGTTYQSLRHNIEDKLKKDDQDNITPRDTHLSDLDKLFNKTDKVDLDNLSNKDMKTINI